MFRTNLFNILKDINICLVRDLCIIFVSFKICFTYVSPAHPSPGKLNLYTRNPIPAELKFIKQPLKLKLEFKRVEKTHVFWEDCFLGSIELIHI